MEENWHELKTWPEYFKAISMGHKMFELRRNDRGFKPGDILLLAEYDPSLKSYTGQTLKRKVDYVLEGEGVELFGLQPGFCIMSISEL